MYRKYLCTIYCVYAAFGMNSHEYIHYLPITIQYHPYDYWMRSVVLFMEVNITKYNLNIYNVKYCTVWSKWGGI